MCLVACRPGVAGRTDSTSAGPFARFDPLLSLWLPQARSGGLRKQVPRGASAPKSERRTRAAAVGEVSLRSPARGHAGSQPSASRLRRGARALRSQVDRLAPVGATRLAQVGAATAAPEKRPGASTGLQKELAELAQAEVKRQRPRAVRLFFEDQARFARISDPRRCWAPQPLRPEAGAQIIRQYSYAFAAVCPHDGTLHSLLLPDVDSEAMSTFLAELARPYPQEILLVVVDGAGWHRSNDLEVPDNLRLVRLPPYSPPLNPVENRWQEIGEKWFPNLVFDSRPSKIACWKPWRRCTRTPSGPQALRASTGLLVLRHSLLPLANVQCHPDPSS